MKGVSGPVDVFELSGQTGIRTRLQAAHQRGLTPFVGRDRELQTLDECFQRIRTGQGQLVFLIGEPGIGKSRRLHEFRQRIGEQAVWHEGHTLTEDLYADSLTEHYEVLAYHFTQGEDWPRALEYFTKAADKAAEACAIQDAVDCCDQALSKALPLAETIRNPTQLWKTQVAMGQLLGETRRAADARRHYTAARTLIEQVTESVRHPELRAGWESSSVFRQVLEIGKV